MSVPKAAIGSASDRTTRIIIRLPSALNHLFKATPEKSDQTTLIPQYKKNKKSHGFSLNHRVQCSFLLCNMNTAMIISTIRRVLSMKLPSSMFAPNAIGLELSHKVIGLDATVTNQIRGIHRASETFCFRFESIIKMPK